MLKKIKISKTDYNKFFLEPFTHSAVFLALLASSSGHDLPFDLGLAWEHVIKLHDDFDEDVWFSLEATLRHLELTENETNLWKHYPSYHYDEPPYDEIDDKLFEKLYAEYKHRILKEVYDVESDD